MMNSPLPSEPTQTTLLAGPPPFTVLTSELVGFLFHLDALNARNTRIVYADLLAEHRLPTNLVSDMHLVVAGLIVWSEGHGFVVTDAGRELAGRTRDVLVADFKAWLTERRSAE